MKLEKKNGYFISTKELIEFAKKCYEKGQWSMTPTASTLNEEMKKFKDFLKEQGIE